MTPILPLLFLACTDHAPGDRPVAVAPQRTTAASDSTPDSIPDTAPAPDTAGATFWDLAPETDWMSSYPVYACPTPDEDDYVVDAPAWSMLVQAFAQTDGGIGMLMSYTGNTTLTYCRDLDNKFEYVNAGRAEGGLVFAGRMWFDDFSPGSLEGMHTAPRHSWKLMPQLWWSDDHVGRPLMVPQPPAGYPDDNPYQDLCFVRVRPHRVAAVWRIQAPPEVFQAARWPEELWGGLYVWWDVRWGEQMAGNGETCFFDHFEGVRPDQVWPDMPEGWEPEQTWTGGQWKPEGE